MSESAEARVIRDYIEKINRNDVDAGLELATDDFRCQVKAPGLAEDIVCNKAEYKRFNEETRKNFSNIKVPSSLMMLCKSLNFLCSFRRRYWIFRR